MTRTRAIRLYHLCVKKQSTKLSKQLIVIENKIPKLTQMSSYKRRKPFKNSFKRRDMLNYILLISVKKVQSTLSKRSIRSKTFHYSRLYRFLDGSYHKNVLMMRKKESWKNSKRCKTDVMSKKFTPLKTLIK